LELSKEKGGFMLAGPDLLIILVIALIVFGPKKLPELAKTIGRALGEFKKTTEEVKESIGINELQEMRSNLTMDLYTVAEKLSTSMTNKETTGDVSTPVKDSIQETTSSPAEALTPIGDGKELEKEKNTKSEGLKGEVPRESVPS
jgi:TatA/E family protein of Tat protein translocase